MGEAREHHFVPQFYLRRFSANGRQIHMFNMARRRVIASASIRGQCSKRNFHGFAPDLERHLGELEGSTATIFAKIHELGSPPPYNTDPWRTLLTFIVFQKLRTEASGNRAESMYDFLGKAALQDKMAQEGIDPDDFAIRSTYPIAVPLSLAPGMLPHAESLALHLFVNRTKRPFLTSDDPVVGHNQYCEGITYRGVTGWDSRGVQFFYPISSTHLLLLYDYEVYKIGAADSGMTVSKLSDQADVAALNQLQILNAAQNVYFSGNPSGSFAERECLAHLDNRPASRMTFVETERTATADGGSSALLHSFQPLLPLHLKLSTIRIRPDWKEIPLHDRAARYRSRPSVRDWHRGSVGADTWVRHAVKRTTRK